MRKLRITLKGQRVRCMCRNLGGRRNIQKSNEERRRIITAQFKTPIRSAITVVTQTEEEEAQDSKATKRTSIATYFPERKNTKRNQMAPLNKLLCFC